MKNPLLLPALGLLALSGLLFSTQDSGPSAAPSAALASGLVVEADKDTRVVVMPPYHEEYWDTIDVGDARPVQLLVVPDGMRFVLTDLWTMRNQDYPQHLPSERDRMWLEDDGDGRRRVVFDTFLAELPHRMEESPSGKVPSFRPMPMRWETGVPFGPGHKIFVYYDFDGERKRDWIRRVHFTGYFEEIPARQR